MRKVKLMLLLLSLAAYSISAQAESNAEPQYVLEKVPFLGGKSVISLTWYTGNISDSQNYEKNLFENFALYLSRSGVPKEIIPEIINTVSSIDIDANSIKNDFNPDKDKIKAEISNNKIRLTELSGDIKVLTPTWWDVKEINLSSSEGRLFTNECGYNDVKAIEFVSAKDMSDLISVDAAYPQVSNALNNGNSLVVQTVMVNPEDRNAAVLVKNDIDANKSSGLRYMVLGNDQNTVNCILRKISDASGESSSSSPVSLTQTSSPVPPVPELSPIILVLTGLLGLMLVLSKYKKN